MTQNMPAKNTERAIKSHNFGHVIFARKFLERNKNAF